VISYADILDAFFRSHDAISGGRSRQYSSIIFAHDEQQYAIAESAIAERPRVQTSLEAAAPFWEAEPYHQKWLLQRKRPLMMALGLANADDLLGPAATILTAAASGKLSEKAALARLDALLESGELRGTAHGEIRAILDPF